MNGTGNKSKSDGIAARLAALPMPLEDYRRYGRQMIVENFGLPGQLLLKRASVLVVGAGGLGCPALLYLAGAGVGHITIIDHDTVELSNLHRQVLHTENRVGTSKAESARLALLERNSTLQIDALPLALTLESLADLELADFSLVLDCTDNAETRYLLNDACVDAGVQLVSGAAIRADGQVVVWNLQLTADDPLQRGPCYRCLFPPPESGVAPERCEDEGVLGTLTGTIGTLMATEAIKLLTGLHDRKPFLLLYSPLNSPPFRTLKIRSKRANCVACRIDRKEGPKPVQMVSCAVDQGEAEYRVAPKVIQSEMASGSSLMLIDTRPATEFGICALPSSINVPLAQLLANPVQALPVSHKGRIALVCRQGNDSLVAARALREEGIEAVDLEGGLKRWAQDVDGAFPVY